MLGYIAETELTKIGPEQEDQETAAQNAGKRESRVELYMARV